LPPALQVHAPKESSDEIARSPDTQFLMKQGMPSDTPVPGKEVTPTITPGEPLKALKEYMRQQELIYLNRVLAQTGGDKEKAAELLGVSLATLYRKLSEDESV